ncbi:MAG: riboflavin synthase [Rickettsiaceae bacterium]|jgi:riboflavin synthase|nr:riboflavin synthase [Rickettsiaceae bacterium]
MFTGIVTDIASVKTLSLANNQDLLISLEFDKVGELKIGCSISCNGACLTLVKQENNELFFQASPETLDKTNIKSWKIGDKINIEFALKMGDELGGHLVSGHVDDVAKILNIKSLNNDSWQFAVAMPKDLKQFIAPKGSIVLNGVSLTVNDVLDDSFLVNIIRHTFDHTNFSNLKIGDYLNLEIDLIARYLKRIINH